MPDLRPAAPGGLPAWTRRPLARVALVVLAGLLALSLALLLVLSLKLRALREFRATGPSWSFPSRIYSDRLELRPGRVLPTSALAAHLAIRGYVRSTTPLEHPGSWAPAAGGVEIYLRGSAVPTKDDAGPERVRVGIERGRITAVEVLGHGGRADSTAPALEPLLLGATYDSMRVERVWLPLAQIPRVVQDAVIASEDRRFRSHFGIDPRSNVRALARNVRAGGVRQGASTITQQLARGLFLGHERTLGRKLAEAALALGLEVLLSKDEILEMYLNSVYWGQTDVGGVAGIDAASRWYFDLPPGSLDAEQAATLAGLIPAPNAFSPFRNPVAARGRRNFVLNAMAETGRLPAREAARLKRTPLSVRRGPLPPERYPSFTGWVRSEIARRLPRERVEHGGLRIVTTLDPVAQAMAESTLAEGVGALEGRIGLPRHALQGACVVMDPASGAVRAMVGGRDPGVGDFNRATQALRQPGSAIKPVVYAAALDPGRGEPRYTPSSTVPDLRRSFPTPEGPWTPRNDHDEYHPKVSLAKALAKSLNVATANLVEQIGPATVARYGERFGLGRMKPVASIGLGSNEVTLLGLTGAYATFANRGVRVPPRPIRSMVDARGKPIEVPVAEPVRVLPRETADLMTGLLEDVVLFGVAYPLRAEYGFTRPVAGKTGTTNDFNDGWFVGFTPELLAGVWVGCDVPRSLGDVAATTALPVWDSIVERLLKDTPVAAGFPADSALELVWIDPWSGGLARGDCPHPMRVPFLPGTQPTRICADVHVPEPDTTATESAPDSAGAPPP